MIAEAAKQKARPASGGNGAAQAAADDFDQGTGDRYVPVARIHASPTNPRQDFPEAELEELASTMRRHGVLQSLLVRPWPADARKGYECVAGERRLRAAVDGDEEEDFPC